MQIGMSLILFCSQPFADREIDADYADERTAAVAAGFSTGLLDYMKVVEGDVDGAIRRVPEMSCAALYRGWMLRPEQYAKLHAALATRGIALVNDADAYRACHLLPDSYAALSGDTPRTTWIEMSPGDPLDMARVMRAIAPFDSGAIMIKDYVKSQKHYWTEACFIPRANDQRQVERVVRRFLELQGEDLVGGLVFREFVPLRMIGKHPKSGMPIATERRTFWFDKELLLDHAYWDDLEEGIEHASLTWMSKVASRIPSRFFTMDVALREDGVWTVIELGDGQVAGLPAPELAAPFYLALADAMNRTGTWRT